MIKNLLSPIKIGVLTIRNRIVFPPIDLALHDLKKPIHPQYIEFLCSLARDNGVGLIISEFTSVADDRFWAPASRFHSDEFVSEFRNLAEQVKSYGAKFFMQLALLGGRAPKGRIVAPSSIESPLYPKIPEELSQAEIQHLIQKWIEAAVRAKRAGFDGVEVHGGHSYLIGEFISPHANQRYDEYGYDFNGRMRFPTEIVTGIKAACGETFPVGFKLSAFEALENGINGALAVDMARRLEKVGVDYLHVSSSTYMLAGTRYPDVPSMYTQEGPLVHFAERIKKGVRIPVMTVAGIVSPELAENIIAEGKADMVAVGRAMFADPQWASKVSHGKVSEIRPCIRCNYCHKKMIIDRAGSVECAVNPGLLGSKPEQASKKVKVVVAGAGPAGLEVALAASSRGHTVYLYEKGNEIGGNVRIGAIPSFKADLRKLIDFYQKQLEKSDIHYFPENELNADRIMEEKAEIVVLAVGAAEYVPDIPGITGESVLTVKKFFQTDYLQKKQKGHVAVLGAGSVGCEAAWYLSLLGRKVYLIDILPYEKLLADEHPTNRFTLLESLAERSVEILDKAKVLEIGSHPYVKVARENVEYKIFLDNIYLATGFIPDNRLAGELCQIKGKRRTPEIYNIGDCAKVRNIHSVIREGYDLGVTL
ncbi:MAG: NAD(P)/FAD-dependent oxidoreductase [Spirochaetota bacterium]